MPNLQLFGLQLAPPQQIALIFDAPVDPDTCDVTAITLRSSQNEGGSTYIPTGGTCASFGESNQVSVQLSSNDWTAINNDPTLATSINNTYISLTGNFIQSPDAIPNNPVDTPLQAAFFEAVPLTISIENVFLDLDSGILSIDFSQTVTSVNPLLISLVNGNFNLTLHGSTGDTPAQPSSSANVTLLAQDLNALKLEFGSSVNFTTWDIILQQGAAENEDQPGLSTPFTMIDLSGLIPDSTPPIINTLTFDMDSGIIIITFDEPIDNQTYNLAFVYVVNVIEPPFTTNYSLTGGVVTHSADFINYQIILSSNTLLQLQSDEFIASTTNNSYLYFQPQSFSDLSSNLLAQSSQSMLPNFSPDTTSPNLISFDLMLDSMTAVLTLTFSEPVKSETFDASHISLLDNTTINSYTLISQELSTTFSMQQTILNLALSSQQTNDVKLLLYNARSNIVYLIMSSEACTDTSDNSVIPISFVNPLLVAQISLDNLHPHLVSYAPDRRPPQNYSMTFIFSEYMDPTTFDINQLTLTLIDSFTGSHTFNSFGNGQVTMDSYLNFTYHFSSSDLSGDFSMLYQLAYYSGNMSIIFGGEFIHDLNGNIIQSPLPSEPFLYNSTETDPVHPMLSSFTLDLVQGTLRLNFSEEVYILASTNALDIASDSSGVNSHTLSSNSYTILQEMTGNTFLITLNSSDVTALLADATIATNIQNTFLRIASNFAIDFSGNNLNNTILIQASNLIIPAATTSSMDTSFVSTMMSTTISRTNIPPSQTISSIITSSEVIVPTLTFSETSPVTSETPVISPTSVTPVISSTSETPSISSTSVTPVISSISVTPVISPTSVTPVISSTSETPVISPTSVTPVISSTSEAPVISSTSVTPSISSTSVTPVISSIGSETSSIVLSSSEPTISTVAVSTISTVTSQTTVAISSTSSVLLPSPTPINIITAALDLDSGLLNISLSSSIQPGAVVVTNIAFINDTMSYTLTASSISSNTGTEVVISIGDADLNILKILEINEYWSMNISSNTFFDSNGNTNPTQILMFSYVPDTTAPTLANSILDMNIGLLSLTFTEPILDYSINSSGFYITNTLQVSPPTQYRLDTVVITTAQNYTIINFLLPLTTLNYIKLDSGTGTNVFNSYIFISAASLSDYSDNLIQSQSTPVSSYISDNTRPSLLSFSLDLDNGVMTLSFSEAIDSSTFDPAGAIITPPNIINESPNVNGTVIGTSNEGDILSVMLHNDNLNEIKFVSYNISYGPYLTIPSTFVTDTAGNLVMPISSIDRIRVTTLISDVTRPQVMDFNTPVMSPNNVAISFLFDEYVLLPSLNEFSMTITVNNSLTNGTYSGFSGGSWSAMTSSTVTYRFSQIDIQTMSFGLAYFISSNGGQVSVTFDSLLATDLYGNLVIPANIPLVQTTQPDSVQPSLQSFSIDLDTGDLVLTFSKNVILLVIPGNIRFQNSASNPSVSYNLSSAAYNSQFGQFGSNITIRLLPHDSAVLFNNTELANSVTDTFILVSTQLVIDYSGNPINITDPVQANKVLTPLTPDNPPILLNATINFNDGSLILTFHTDINLSLVNPLITLTNSANSYSYTLTSGVLNTENNDSTIVHITLSDYDLSSLKYIYMMANDQWNVSLHSNAVTSNEGETNRPQTLQITTVIPDTTGPSVVIYTFDLNSGTITITFNEPMSISNGTYNTSGIWLSGTLSMQPNGISLANGQIIASENIDRILTIQLDDSILNTIKANGSVGTEITNTNMFFTSDSFQDISLNSIQPSVQSVLPLSFIADVTRPNLNSYSLDLNNGVLSLSFDEAVYVDSLNVQGITIYTPGSLTTFNIKNSTVLSNGYTTVVNVQILNLNELKLYVVLQTGGVSETRLNISSDAITDTSHNQVLPSFDINPMQVTPDTTSPILIGLIAGNVTQSTLQMIFNEPIQPSTFNPAGLTLYLNTSTGLETFTGLTGIVSSDVSTVLLYTITDAKFQGTLELMYQQAYYSGSIGVALSSISITDISGNSVTSTTNPIYYFSMMTDSIVPQVVSFELDLDASRLTMIFSEPVVINQISGNIIIQNSANSPTQSFTLTSSSYSSQEGLIGTNITLMLLLQDVISIAANSQLGNSISNTYLNIGANLAVDYSGNFIQVPSNAIQVMTLTNFSGPLSPQVTSFDLDLDSDQLTLHFNSPVNVSTLVPTKITLVNTSVISISSQIIVLSNVTVIAQGEQSDFRLLLSLTDIINIKRHPICYTVDNCYAKFDQGLAYNNLMISSDLTPPIQVSILTNDVTPPRFLSFPVFDLNSGLFTIIFTEPINGSSSDFTQVTFANSVSEPTQMVTLTEGYTSPDHVEIDFFLHRNDLNALKYHLNLCTSRSNCWIRLPSFFIKDIGSNPFLHSNYQPGALASYHQPTVFVADSTPPVLESFSIDMNLGQLVLSFDEVINETNFIASDVTLLNERSGQLSLVLNNTSQYTRINNGTSIRLILTTDNLNWIKARDMYSTISNSYLSLITEMSDVSGNVFNDISIASALQASIFIPDTTQLQLTSFDTFNIDNGNFFITFNEPVEVNSLNLTGIILSSSININSVVTYQLTGGTSLYTDETKLRLMITLTRSDRVQIKLTNLLATSDFDTYISLYPSIITDTAGNPNSPIPIMSAIKLTSGGYVPDTSIAALSSAELDMNIGVLKLIFNDVIDVSSVNPFLLTIQNKSVNIDTSFYTMTGSIVSTQSSDEVYIYLQRTDLNSIKRDLSLGTRAENSYITFPAALAEDIEGRNINGIPDNIAQMVSNYIADTTSPVLESYSLDMDNGVLSMTLSEPVLLNSFTPTQLRLQSSFSNPTMYYNLTSGTVVPQITNSVADSHITLTISYNDLNEVKSRTSLATTVNNTYISVGSLFLDTSSNDIAETYGLQTTVYTVDTTLPELVTFSLDLKSTAKVILKFSEAVYYTTNLQSTIVLQNRKTNPTVTLQLTSSETVTQTALDEVSIDLSNSHNNQLLTDTDIAESSNTLFISMTPGGIYDYSAGQGQGQSIATLTHQVTYLCKFTSKIIYHL